MKSILLLVCSCIVGASLAEDVSLAGEGWRFVKDTEGKLQAQAVDFDASGWETVRVPHDWAIAGPFDEKAPSGGTGKLPWKGVGWYRRTFDLAQEDAGKSVFLVFDGVMASPDVFVNGTRAGGWSYGYESVCLDVTPWVKFEKGNVLAVRVDTTKMFSRWYPGAGIYRKVTLKIRPAAHFVSNGIFVTTPSVTRDKALVRVAWELEGPVADGSSVKVSLSGAAGRVLATSVVPAEQGVTLLSLDSPRLWDVDDPYLHVAEVSLQDASASVVTTEKVRFGVRTIAFPTPTEEPARSDRLANGFHLNGRRVQLKGVNLHSDLGPLGMAFDKSAMRRQLHLMKEMGANALRTSHNCPAPEVLDLCDEMGILVWDECFDKWGRSAGRTTEDLEVYIARILKNFVRRDRNHPSVIAWSMSNEICDVGHKWSGPDGLTRERCSYFREVMRGEDASRPIGNGNIGFMSGERILSQGIYDDLDISGWNYGASYRPVKRRLPRQAIVYTESASAFSTYGFYEERLPTHKRDYATNVVQTSGYDFTAGPDIADIEFDRMESDVYCCGEFVWTGIDYLGEPTPYARQARSSYFGIADLMGVPKDRYWLYRSYWNDRAETLHIVPHWTWPGREGKSVPVFVYTSGDAAELFLNGRSLGIRRKGKSLDESASLFAGAEATASSEQATHPAGDVLSGGSESRWCAANARLPAWIKVEMPSVVTFRSVQPDFEFEPTSYAYVLEASSNGRDWEEIFRKELGSSAYPVFETPRSAKALRLTVTATVPNIWASVRRLVVGNDLSPRPSAYYDVCRKYRLMWLDVPYEPGEVKAVAYRQGRKIGETLVRTAGAPVKLVARQEARLTDAADELLWVQVDAFDAKGVRDPLAMNRVRFSLQGPGRILGVGNGNANAFESFAKTDSHPMYFGKVVAVVRREGTGEIRLTVSADGLESDTIELR